MVVVDNFCVLVNGYGYVLMWYVFVVCFCGCSYFWCWNSVYRWLVLFWCWLLYFFFVVIVWWYLAVFVSGCYFWCWFGFYIYIFYVDWKFLVFVLILFCFSCFGFYCCFLVCVLGWLFFGLFVCWVVGGCEFCGLGYGVFVFFY